MMNKTEFEARVREKAKLQKTRINKRNKIIKIATAASGTVVAVACLALVITKMNNTLYESNSSLDGTMNGIKNEMMNAAPEISEDSDGLNGGINSSGVIVEDIYSEEMVPNDPEKNEVLNEDADGKLFAEINSIIKSAPF